MNVKDVSDYTMLGMLLILASIGLKAAEWGLVWSAHWKPGCWGIGAVMGLASLAFAIGGGCIIQWARSNA